MCCVHAKASACCEDTVWGCCARGLAYMTRHTTKVRLDESRRVGLCAGTMRRVLGLRTRAWARARGIAARHTSYAGGVARAECRLGALRVGAQASSPSHWLATLGAGCIGTASLPCRGCHSWGPTLAGAKPVVRLGLAGAAPPAAVLGLLGRFLRRGRRWERTSGWGKRNNGTGRATDRRAPWLCGRARARRELGAQLGGAVRARRAARTWA
jgi:hypothetical protein